MPAARRALVAAGLAALGHGLVITGFLQPWVAGQFGARDRLSGLDLVRITDGLIDHGLAGDALTLPITRVLLLGVPVAAANALLVLALGRAGLIQRQHARHLAAVLALPAAAVVFAAHGLLILAAVDDGIVDGPAYGLFVATSGAILAASSWLLERSSATHERASDGRPDGAVSEA